MVNMYTSRMGQAVEQPQSMYGRNELIVVLQLFQTVPVHSSTAD